VRDLRFRRLFSPKTSRGPLPWSVLATIILVTLVVLWSVWVITESEWLQWAGLIASLLVWDLLVIRAGDGQERLREDRDLSVPVAIAIFLYGVVSLGLKEILASLSEDWSLYPGQQTISFILISVPILIWVNVYLRSRQEKPESA
jgi:hypothetical protein